MSRHPGYNQKPRSRYAVISGEQPVIDQGDPHDSKWMQAGGDARDRGRMVELISKDLTGSDRMMVGLAWFEPGDVHLLHHHPHTDEWYYMIDGSVLFTVGGDLIRGDRDVHTGRCPAPDREAPAALDSILGPVLA